MESLQRVKPIRLLTGPRPRSCVAIREVHERGNGTVGQHVSLFKGVRSLRAISVLPGEALASF